MKNASFQAASSKIVRGGELVLDLLGEFYAQIHQDIEVIREPSLTVIHAGHRAEDAVRHFQSLEEAAAFCMSS